MTNNKSILHLPSHSLCQTGVTYKIAAVWQNQQKQGNDAGRGGILIVPSIGNGVYCFGLRLSVCMCGQITCLITNLDKSNHYLLKPTLYSFSFVNIQPKPSWAVLSTHRQTHDATHINHNSYVEVHKMSVFIALDISAHAIITRI